MPREFLVGSGEEVVALGMVLADEEDIGCVATGPRWVWRHHQARRA